MNRHMMSFNDVQHQEDNEPCSSSGRGSKSKGATSEDLSDEEDTEEEEDSEDDEKWNSADAEDDRYSIQLTFVMFSII